MRTYTFGTVAALLAAATLAGCTRPDTRSTTLDEAMDLFWENRMEEALAALNEVVAADTHQGDALVWRAEALRRLGRHDDAMRDARAALQTDACNTFAHTVIADASVAAAGAAGVDIAAGSDTSWSHLMSAIECDSTDGNVWESLWGIAIRRDDPDAMWKSTRKMAETGFLTDAVLSFGRWLIRDLPPNAILVTNGDMDTYPAMAVQSAEQLRPDVAVVERGLLNLDWGRDFYRDRLGVTFPFTDSDLDALTPRRSEDGFVIRPDTQILEAWIDETARGTSPQPIALAATVYPEFFEPYTEHLQFAGPFRLVKPNRTAPRDTVTLRRSLDGIQPGSFSGPWVSGMDYSPIRRSQTPGIVRVVTHSALTYAEELLRDRRLADAAVWADWAEDFEATTELGPSYGERIDAIRRAATVNP